MCSFEKLQQVFQKERSVARVKRLDVALLFDTRWSHCLCQTLNECGIMRTAFQVRFGVFQHFFVEKNAEELFIGQIGNTQIVGLWNTENNLSTFDDANLQNIFKYHYL